MDNTTYITWDNTLDGFRNESTTFFPMSNKEIYKLNMPLFYYTHPNESEMWYKKQLEALCSNN